MFITNGFNMSFLKNTVKSISSEKGSVSVEFSIVIISFILIMYLVFDLGATIAKQGRLERTNHSLASMLRERKALYNSNENITQEQVDQLLSVGQMLLHEPNLTIAVDALFLAPDQLNPSSNESAYINKMLSFNAGNGKCLLAKNSVNISALKGLSPYASSTARWVPIYRVRACIPNEASIFKQLANVVNDEILPDLTTSDVVISRN